MNLDVGGKVFMLGGASRGLGYGIATALAAEGATVALAGRDRAAVDQAAAQLRERTGATVLGTACDVSDAAAILRWRDQVVAELGGIDGLLVNAGGPPPGGFDQLDDAAWEKGFQLTLMSSVRLIRAALPSMRARGGGSILAITSHSTREPDNFLLLSAVMRSGVASLVKGIAATLAAEGIRINCLMPGLIETDRLSSLIAVRAGEAGISIDEQRRRMQATVPLGRLGDADEFGRAGAFLLSPAAGYITGTTLVVDGGRLKGIS